MLQLFRDTPREWDAWDINKEDQRNGRDLLDAAQVDVDGSAVAIRHEIANTVIDVRLTLLEGRLHFHLEIDRQESQKLLKLAFPLDIRAERAASEIQFGHLNRPIQRNTSWDAARFETVAHRWIRVGEPSYGVVIANDVVYEHDVRSTQAPSGRTMTITRLSLLRAPRYPDPTADNGPHTFTVSLRPADIPQAVEDGYAQSLPIRMLTGSPLTPLVSVTHPGIVVESIKLAEDRSGALVVRLYEAHGNRARGSVENSFMWDTVDTTDLLERSTDSEVIHSQRGGSGRLSVPPPLRTRHPLLRESARRRGGTQPRGITMSTSGRTPRAEYPRPQFRRDRWINLNGTWSFEIDRSDSGRERGLVTKNLEGTITIPFAPEAELSGVGDLDFLYAVWYRTVLMVPADRAETECCCTSELSITRPPYGWTASRWDGTVAVSRASPWTSPTR